MPCKHGSACMEKHYLGFEPASEWELKNLEVYALLVVVRLLYAPKKTDRVWHSRTGVSSG